MKRADTRLALILLLSTPLVAGCGVKNEGHKKAERAAQAGSTAPGTTAPPVSNGFVLPAPRAEHTATLLPSGDIFVAGGVDVGGNPLDSTLIISQTTVLPGPTMSAPRVGHSAIFDATTNTVLISGGQSDALGTLVLNTSESYDPATGAFLPGPTLAEARTHHAAALIPGANLGVLFAGGKDASGNDLASAEILDLTSGLSTALTPGLSQAQADARAVLLDTGDVLLISGRSASGAPSPELFDPSAGTFSTISGSSVSLAATASLGPGQVLLAGGEVGGAEVSSSEVYQSSSQTSAPVPALGQARSEASATRLSGGAVAVVGGRTAQGASDFVEVYAGSPASFVAGPNLAVARWGHATVMRPNNQVIVFGGYDSTGFVLDSIEEIDLASVAGTTPPVTPIPPPPGSITTFPYDESFDAGLGGWTNVTVGDDFDWTQNSGTTPSTSTGPTGDHTNGSGSYIYTESSYPNDNGQAAIIEGPTFATFTTLEMRFWYHMLGDTSGTTVMGTLSLDVSANSGATWDLDVWTLTGTQGNSWNEAIVDLSSYAGQAITVRFRGTTASYRSDMAIDDVHVSDVPGAPPPVTPPPNTPVSLPYAEDFDVGLGLWKNAAGDDFDWTQNSGSTVSTSTGPSSDHTSGSGSYLYTESSYPNDSGQVAIFEGPSFGSFSTLELRFWYHMLGDTAASGGNQMGTLSLDVSSDGGTTWDLDVWTLTGTQGASWLEAVVDLTSYAGQTVKLRFRGTTASYRSDMAIDDIQVTGTP